MTQEPEADWQARYEAEARARREAEARLDAKQGALEVTQRELQEARDQFQAVLDAVPGGVSWINSNLEYLGINSHLASVFNLKPHDFVGHTIGFLNNSPGFEEFVRELFAGEVVLHQFGCDAGACDEVDESVVLDFDEASEGVPVDGGLFVDDDERRRRDRGFERDRAAAHGCCVGSRERGAGFVVRDAEARGEPFAFGVRGDEPLQGVEPSARPPRERGPDLRLERVVVLEDRERPAPLAVVQQVGAAREGPRLAVVAQAELEEHGRRPGAALRHRTGSRGRLASRLQERHRDRPPDREHRGGADDRENTPPCAHAGPA